jgi:protein gp37
VTKTKIEWADEVWNPVTGCTKVSPGCAHCYAERLAGRFWKGRKFTDVRVHPERLDDPLRWKKPRRVFVNSMSDLFHPAVETLWIAEVFSTMQRCPQHTFMILTKRPERMHELLSRWDHGRSLDHWPVWPLPNVWLGVSAETQKEADARIPILLQTPAAVRFVSAEPMLGPVILREYWMPHYDPKQHYAIDPPNYRDKLGWVICGGESGPGARPMHPDWARGLRDHCQAAQVPFFFKQWGEWLPIVAQYGDDDLIDKLDMDADSICLGDRGTIFAEERGGKQTYWCGFQPDPGQNPWFMERVGKTAAGRELDGRTWEERPGE